MNKAKWIWSRANYNYDEYAEFVENFCVNPVSNTILKISSDSVYTVYLNDEMIAFSGCADYPNYKFFDEIDLSNHIENKDNTLKIQVWYIGADSQTYINAKPGLIFEVLENDVVVAYSNESTLSREMNEYKFNYLKKITVQLGLSFLYDASKQKTTYSNSVLIDKTYDMHKRNLNQLYLEKRREIKVTKFQDHYLIDMGMETAGFLDLELGSKTSQKLLITYGEHLADKKVRQIIDQRDFSVEYITKVGLNKYMNTFRRLAGRYIEVYFTDDIDIKYLGIRPVYYPLTIKPFDFKDELLNKIYSVSIETIRLCMHEHYEDCPWREQALYTMDSRNQMLCGYYAFNEREFMRHSLLLISKGLREDNMLSLCFPAGLDLPIPFFSLVYIIQVKEYLDYTNDYSLFNEVKDVLTKIINTFKNRITKDNLISNFEKTPYWNFYEWADGSEGYYEENDQRYDLILNAMFVYTMGYYDSMFDESFDTSKIKNAIHNTFYNKELGVYKLSTKNELYSQLGNSFALLIGLGDKTLIDKIINDKNMVQATLSMKAFYYDALLSIDDSYKDYIIDEIKKNYKSMLDDGATSFYETIEGESAFDNAGSLCHGWSAIPIYYFNKLLK